MHSLVVIAIDVLKCNVLYVPNSALVSGGRCIELGMWWLRGMPHEGNHDLT